MAWVFNKKKIHARFSCKMNSKLKELKLLATRADVDGVRSLLKASVWDSMVMPLPDGSLLLLSACQSAEVSESAQIDFAKFSAQMCAASLNACDYLGWSPLHAASKLGRQMLCSALLELGADASLRTKNGVCAAHFMAACKLSTDFSSSAELFDRLLNACGGVDTRTRRRETPLHYCCFGAGDVLVFEHLVARQCLLDVVSKRVATPLRLAIQARNFDVALRLIAAGAKVFENDLKEARRQADDGVGRLRSLVDALEAQPLCAAPAFEAMFKRQMTTHEVVSIQALRQLSLSANHAKSVDGAAVAAASSSSPNALMRRSTGAASSSLVAAAAATFRQPASAVHAKPSAAGTDEVVLLAGEKLMGNVIGDARRSIVGQSRQGTLTMTNYRLAWRDASDATASIDVTLFDVMRARDAGSVVDVQCKSGASLVLEFAASTHAKRLAKAVARHVTLAPLTAKFRSANFFAFAHGAARGTSVNCGGWSSFDVRAEFERLGFRFGVGQWRWSRVNENNGLSELYPDALMVPERASRELVWEASMVFDRGGVPMPCWRHARSDGVLSRACRISYSMQTLTLMKADVMSGAGELLDAMHRVVRSAHRTRVYSLNSANVAQLERTSTHWRTDYCLELPSNAHVCRVHAKWRERCAAMSDERVPPSQWLEQLSECGWRKLVGGLLAAAARLASAVADGEHCVVCSGSAPSSHVPVLAVAQLLLDAHYRSVAGFATLLHKEFVHVGYEWFPKYARPQKRDEVRDSLSSPFVLFLDAVHQLTRQFPACFEFDDDMLVALVGALYSGRYGEFLGGTERVRLAKRMRERTASALHECLASRAAHFRRRRWPPSAEQRQASSSSSKMLVPDVDDLMPWHRLYLRHCSSALSLSLVRSGPLKEAVDLSHTLLPLLPASFVERMRAHGVRSVDLSHALLTSLSGDARGLLGMRTLRTLNVAHNLLRGADAILSTDGTDALRELNAAHNALASLPVHLVGLRVLDISFNRVRSLRDVGALRALERLELAHNDIERLDASIGCCVSLRHLDVSHNRIALLDGALFSLAALEHLDLSHNRVVRLSDRVDKLAALRVLDVGHNQLDTLPPSLATLRATLRTFNAGGNPLSAIPAHVIDAGLEPLLLFLRQIAVSGDTSWSSMKLLFVGQEAVGKTTLLHRFIELTQQQQQQSGSGDDDSHQSDEFVVVSRGDGSDNDDSDDSDDDDQAGDADDERDGVPRKDGKKKRSLTALPSLRPERLLRASFAPPQRGSAALPSSLSSSVSTVLASPKKKRRGSRVAPAARHAATATTQQRSGKRLRRSRQAATGKRYDKNRSTDGVDVRRWQVANGVQFRCFDFGGQQVFHATHEFFLSERSIYCIVFSVLNESSYTSRLVYWLRKVSMFHRETAPLVIVVGTHIDMATDVASVDSVRDYVRDTVCARFPFVHAVQMVASNGSDGDASISALVDEVIALAERHPIMRQRVPRSYTLLAEHIEQVAAAGRATLGWREFKELARDITAIRGDDDLAHLGRFLHDTGIILHFDHARGKLHDLVVVDAHFVAQLLASVQTFAHRWVRRGVLQRAELIVQVWSNRYAAEQHEQLLSLLQVFGVMLPLRDDDGHVSSFLVPAMLPDEEPPLAASFGFDNSSSSSSSSSQSSPPSLSSELAAAAVEDDLVSTSVSVSSMLPFVAGNVAPHMRRYRFDFISDGFFPRLLSHALHVFTCPIRWRWGFVALDRRFPTRRLLVRYEPDAFTLTIAYRDASGECDQLQLVLQLVDDALAGYHNKVQVERSVLCRHCLAKNAADITVFSLDQCVVALSGGAPLVCCEERVAVAYVAPDMTLQRVPRVRIVKERVIGRGGFGVVYRGRLLRGDGDDGDGGDASQVIVAIKELHALSAASPSTTAADALASAASPTEVRKSAIVEAFAEFQHEVLVMSTLAHPNLVKLLGITVEPSVCMVLEFVPAGDLSQLLDRFEKVRLLVDVVHPELNVVQLERGQSVRVLDSLDDDTNAPRVVLPCGERTVTLPRASVVTDKLPLRDDEIPWSLRVKLALDMARAMRYLHSVNVVHRDLRSPNVFVVSLDERAAINAKVADFGLSSVLHARTTSGALATYQWLAPEVIRPDASPVAAAEYGLNSDKYSFAIVCWEIAARHMPFIDDADIFARFSTRGFFDKHACIAAICSDEALRPAIPDDTPDEYAALMRECWRADADARPEWTAIVDRLAALLSQLTGRRSFGLRYSFAESSSVSLSSPSSSSVRRCRLVPLAELAPSSTVVVDRIACCGASALAAGGEWHQGAKPSSSESIQTVPRIGMVRSDSSVARSLSSSSSSPESSLSSSESSSREALLFFDGGCGSLRCCELATRSVVDERIEHGGDAHAVAALLDMEMRPRSFVCVSQLGASTRCTLWHAESRRALATWTAQGNSAARILCAQLSALPSSLSSEASSSGAATSRLLWLSDAAGVLSVCVVRAAGSDSKIEHVRSVRMPLIASALCGSASSTSVYAATLDNKLHRLTLADVEAEAQVALAAAAAADDNTTAERLADYGQNAKLASEHAHVATFLDRLSSDAKRNISRSLVHARRSRVLLSCTGSSISVWRASTLQLLQSISLHQDIVTALVVVKLASRVLVVSADVSGIMVVWEIASRSAIHRVVLTSMAPVVRLLSTSASERASIVSTHLDGSIHCWQLLEA
jgi:serine/threonine protein kinase/GTPase SAR1 family protein